MPSLERGMLPLDSQFLDSDEVLSYLKVGCPSQVNLLLSSKPNQYWEQAAGKPILTIFLNMGQPWPLFGFINCWAFYNFDYNKSLTIIGELRNILTRHIFTSDINSAMGGHPEQVFGIASWLITRLKWITVVLTAVNTMADWCKAYTTKLDSRA